MSFRYVSQGKTLYHSAGDGKLSSAVFSIYGREMLRSMHEVDGHQAGLILKGFVGVGESGRGSRNHQSFFINGQIYEVVDFVRGGGSSVPGARIVRQIPDVRAAPDHAV